MKYLSIIFLSLSIYISPLSCTQLPQKELVVVVHGVWFPLMSHYVHKMDCPKGLVKSTDLGQATLGRLADTLHASDSRLFHRDSIYNFGWSGKLSVAAREQAAQELFTLLSRYPGKKTIIAHSHGANVALYLAKLAQEKQDMNFKIDNLILLACPVQKRTSGLVNSSLFNKIFHYYSKSDIAQVIDPQGLCPLFSQRLFKSPKVKEAAITHKGKDLAHNDFLQAIFLQKLPKLLYTHAEEREFDIA